MTTPAVSLTRGFTDLLSAWPADDPALLDRCRLLLLDGLAVAVAGAGEPGPRLMAAQARSESPTGPSTVIGQGFATSVAQRRARQRHGDARAGFRADVESAEPCTLATAAGAARARGKARTGGRRTAGTAVLRAIAKGVEAQGRLRLASGQIEPAKLSMHPPGAVGPLATALACGDMLGLQGRAIGGSCRNRRLAIERTARQCRFDDQGAALRRRRGQRRAGRDACGRRLLGRHGRAREPARLGRFAVRGDVRSLTHLLAPIGSGRALEPWSGVEAVSFAICNAFCNHRGAGGPRGDRRQTPQANYAGRHCERRRCLTSTGRIRNRAWMASSPGNTPPRSRCWTARLNRRVLKRRDVLG